jgi:anti-anti-sigma regulatory factor
MLKITVQIEEDTIILALEGKLAGPWVKEMELCWRTAASPQRIYPIRVDLSAVTFIDAEGKALLGQMCREGAKLVATGCLNKSIVANIMESESQGEGKLRRKP